MRQVYNQTQSVAILGKHSEPRVDRILIMIKLLGGSVQCLVNWNKYFLAAGTLHWTEFIWLKVFCTVDTEQAVKIWDSKYQLTFSAVWDTGGRLEQVSQLSDSAPDD